MSHETSTRLGASAYSEFLSRYGVVAAMAVGLIARVVLTTALVAWNNVPTHWDDASYAQYARAVVDTGRLATHHFPVGYPLFVALCLKIGGGSFAAVRAANVLLGVATIAIVSRIANLCYGRSAAVVAAWLTALYPPLVFMTSRVMSETLFITLLMLSLYWFLASTEDGRTRGSAIAGSLFALASLVRSNLLPMFPFIPLWQIWRAGSKLRTRLVAAIVCSVVTLTILALPGLYFLATKGEFIPLATNAGQTFYGANNPLADGGWVQVEDHQELLSSIPAEVRKSPQAYSKAQNRLAMQWIRENPSTFLRLLPKKFANAWIPGLQKSETTSKSKGASLLLLLSFGLVMLGAIVGRSRFRPMVRDGLLLAVPITYAVLSLIFYGNPRIGLFCAPVLIVYTSAWLASHLGWALGRR